MFRKMLLLAVSCIALTSCQLFQNRADLQEKIMNAAKDAVVKVVEKNIDKREDISESTKEFLKEVAKKFIDSTFERLKTEYEKLSQEEIEKDLTEIVDKNIDTVCGSYLKMQKSNK
jgi:ribonuclease HII